ncbi:hypothetical protein ONZ51_g12936 [Trametes cubensis]|uniref:Uncharacterized protein n=1 Tax=Trametes cubensis TaxID=1111947 RepID=A0AAD7TF70_9APHY|nr:hypothetical protein ONZ51_g12936 [Trametes cubensis]
MPPTRSSSSTLSHRPAASREPSAEKGLPKPQRALPRQVFPRASCHSPPFCSFLRNCTRTARPRSCHTFLIAEDLFRGSFATANPSSLLPLAVPRPDPQSGIGCASGSGSGSQNHVQNQAHHDQHLSQSQSQSQSQTAAIVRRAEILHGRIHIPLPRSAAGHELSPELPPPLTPISSQTQQTHARPRSPADAHPHPHPYPHPHPALQLQAQPAYSHSSTAHVLPVPRATPGRRSSLSSASTSVPVTIIPGESPSQNQNHHHHQDPSPRSHSHPHGPQHHPHFTPTPDSDRDPIAFANPHYEPAPARCPRPHPRDTPSPDVRVHSALLQPHLLHHPHDEHQQQQQHLRATSARRHEAIRIRLPPPRTISSTPPARPRARCTPPRASAATHSMWNPADELVSSARAQFAQPAGPSSRRHTLDAPTYDTPGLIATRNGNASSSNSGSMSGNGGGGGSSGSSVTHHSSARHPSTSTSVSASMVTAAGHGHGHGSTLAPIPVSASVPSSTHPAYYPHAAAGAHANANGRTYAGNAASGRGKGPGRFVDSDEPAPSQYPSAPVATVVAAARGGVSGAGRAKTRRGRKWGGGASVGVDNGSGGGRQRAATLLPALQQALQPPEQPRDPRQHAHGRET